MNTASEAVFWVLAAALTAAVTAGLVRVLPADASSRRLSLGLAAAVPLAALGMYALLGHPALTQWRTRPTLPPAIADAVARLTKDTVDHPDDAGAWVLLAEVDRKIQHYAAAETAFRRALALKPDAPGLKIALGETLLDENGGAVTPDIAALFQADPADPVARYYLALAKSQAADWPGALTDWQALKATLPADSPLNDLVDARIEQARRVTGLVQDR